MIKLIKCILVATGIMTIGQVNGQPSLTMEQYLRTAQTDQTLEQFQAQLNFLKTNKYNSPWLNRVEFRIGSEDANISMNEYRLRVSPTNPGEVKANKLYYEKHVKNLGTQYKVALNQALKNRYQMLIDYKQCVQSITLRQQNLNELNEVVKNMVQMGMDNFDAGVIIGIQSDQTDIMLAVENLKAQRSELEYLMTLDVPNASLIGLELQSLIGVDQIKEYVASSESQSAWTSLYVLEAEEDMQLKEQMLKIDRAESHSNIGYIQGNFDSDRGNELQDHFGFQVGVRLPLVNPDKPDQNRDRVKLIEEQKELDVTKSFVNRQKELSVIRINQLVSQYQMLRERIALSKQIKLPVNGLIDLSDVTKIKKYQFKLTMEQMLLEKEIRELFIEYLDIKGLLVSEPMLNYLSPNFQPIQP